MTKKTKHAVLGIEKLNGLDTSFRIKARKVVEKMQAKGWRLRILWGRRTKKENDALVKKGRAKKTSKHLDGKALDLIDRNVAYTNDKNHEYYKDLEQISKEVGITWGGWWKSPWDPCHIEAK